MTQGTGRASAKTARTKQCRYCAGSGECSECDGKRTVDGETCGECDGSGECQDCDGEGVVKS